MFPRIINRTGLLAAILLVVACFMPWTYHADIGETFTGFYSYRNEYGRPGKFLSFCGGAAFILMYLPKIWAKRVNLFLCAIVLGYAIKTYILFTSCYNAYCPDKQAGIYLMLVCAILLMVAAVFPDLAIRSSRKS